MNLAAKRIVITGASQGLGLSVARAFLREGASVLICARNGEQLEAARSSLLAEGAGRVFATVCDVGREADVDGLVSDAERLLGGVDVLVANAGIYGPKAAIEDVDWEEWIDALKINLIGTVYCCRAFLPGLRLAGRGKILIISGGGATKPLPFLSAYAVSKAGVVRFGETLAEELRPAGIDVNMIAPGALNTRLLDEILQAGPEKVGSDFYNASLRQLASGGTSPELGASLCVYLASQKGDGITGKLISAQWDPWARLHEFGTVLAATDIYTLRRIVPADRGQTWDGV